jgi:serine/threonine-protein kinase
MSESDEKPPEHKLPTSVGSGLMAQQPTPSAEHTVAVAKICPQCGSEYETGDRFCPKDGAPLRPKSGDDPLVGRVLADRYLILARLGEGGMGRVYLAEHVKMTRQCAVKVMNPSLVNDTESAQRFAREASSAARILHPNVAAVFDYGEADKVVYLVMEFVDGESLSAILARDGQLDPRRAIDLGRQIADGLHAAHELGIVHRDLKPDNVIVAHTRSGKEVPKVVDFGIAKAVSDSQQDALTRSGLVIGTPEYMSPEQLLGDPVDARTDIYSLGCILYQMLTGEQPFAADSREQMIRRRLHEAPPHVRDKIPELPRRLDTLITHMLARSPGDRLASAAEGRDQLDPALVLSGWDPSSASGKVFVPSGPSAITPNTDPSLQPTMPMPKVRTSPVRIFVGAALGSVLLLGGLTMWSRRQAENPPLVSAPRAAPPTIPSEPSPEAVKGLPTLSKSDTAKPDSAAAKPPVNTMPASVRGSIDTLRTAIQSRDIARVVRAFPGITQTQQSTFVSVFNATSGKISTTFLADTLHTSGTKATMGLRLTLKAGLRAGGSQTFGPFAYDAQFEKHGAKWDLTALVLK